jgi:MFS family permease
MNVNAAGATVQPRGWYYGWNIVAVCILSQTVANGLTYNALSLFLRDWSTQLHAPISQLTLTIAIMLVVCAVLSPIVGAMADKYPARRLLVFGLLGMALFYFLISKVSAAWQVLTLYGVLAPLSLVLSTSVPVNALIARWFVRRRGLALGLAAFGIGMGGVLLPPVIAAMLPTAGWRAIWRDGGLLIAVIVVPLTLLIVRDRPTEREGLHYLSSDGSPPAQNHHAHAAVGGDMGWRDVLARRNFWLLVAIYLPMMALYGACGQNIAPYALHHGLSQESAGVLLSVLSLAHVVATLVLGLLSDRFGNRLPLVGLAALMVAGAGTLAFGTGQPVITLGCALIGLGGGVFTLLAAAIAVEFGAEGFGRAFGLSMLFLPVASLSAFVMARTQESTGSYTPALMGFAVLVAMAGLLSLLLRERRASLSPVQ